MKKNRKGTTVIEVVVSFAVIALAAGIGFTGIGVGGNFFRKGADLKFQRDEAESTILTDIMPDEVKVIVSGSVGGTDLNDKQMDAVKYQTINGVFTVYTPKEGSGS